LNCYEAGRILVEKGASSLSGGCRVGSSPSHHPPPNSKTHHKSPSPLPPLPAEEQKNRENPAISQNLVPLLTEQGTHPQFAKRGISGATCEYLGCGFLNRRQ